MILLFCFNIGFIFFFHLLIVSVVIVSLAHPAQVAGLIVQMIAVYVIDSGAAFWIWVRAESLCDKSADKIMLAFTILG